MLTTSSKFFGLLLVASSAVALTTAVSDDEGDDDDQGEATIVRGTVTAVTSNADGSVTATFTRTDDGTSTDTQVTLDSTTTILVNGVATSPADFASTISGVLGTDSAQYSGSARIEADAATVNGAPLASRVSVRNANNEDNDDDNNGNDNDNNGNDSDNNNNGNDDGNGNDNDNGDSQGNGGSSSSTVVRGTITNIPSVTFDPNNATVVTAVTVTFSRTDDGTTTTTDVSLDSTTTILVNDASADLTTFYNDVNSALGDLTMPQYSGRARIDNTSGVATRVCVSNLEDDDD